MSVYNLHLAGPASPKNMIVSVEFDGTIADLAAALREFGVKTFNRYGPPGKLRNGKIAIFTSHVIGITEGADDFPIGA